MHAVAENSTTTIPSENGTTKGNKKKNKNNKKQKNSETAPPPEIQNVSTEKSLNTCKKNGTLTNGQIKVKNSDGKSDGGECLDIKVNGCAKSEQDHGVENGEVTAVANPKKSRSRNQRKKRQKNAQNCLENGENKVNDETNAEIKVSNEIINSNNNNIGDKGLANDSDVIENGSDNCLGSITELNHIPETISEASPPTSPESKSQSKSSPSSSKSSSSSSSSTKLVISSLPSQPIPQPSSTPSPRHEDQSSSSHEQTRSSPENQGLDLDKTEKKEEETTIVSPVGEVAAGPSTEDEGAVGGVDRSNIVIEYKQYESELQMQDIMRLIQSELSEPYSIYTYRYFIYNWPKLCFLAAHGDEYVGAIVCKLGMHMNVRRGYIAMLAVKKEYRKMKIGTTLVEKAIEAMLEDGADEVVLETEMKNTPALRLYENLGFVRDKRLFRYYLNGVDALRLKLWFR